MSEAVATSELDGTGIEEAPRHRLIDARQKGQHSFWAFVHADYVRRAHKGPDLEAVVTRNGEPITCNGETLTVGMCPPERRFGIGPASGGTAEVLLQHEFEREHEKVYMAGFALRNAPAPDPNLRHKPNVYDFVSVKEDPADKSSLIPLGMGVLPPVQRTEQYSQENDTFVPIAPQRDERDERIEALERKLAAAVGESVDKSPELEEEDKEQETAPCGALVAKGYVSRHTSRCGNEACQT